MSRLTIRHFLPFNLKRLTFLSIFILSPLSSEIAGDKKPYWYSHDEASGKYIPRTKAELDSVLAIHKEWLNIFKTSEGKYDIPTNSFTSVHLDSSILTHVGLDSALLIKLSLNYSKLDSSFLSFANLSYSNLRGVSLTNANLWKSNLTNSILWEASLTYANLLEANLSNAILLRANLSHAIFWDANLSNANCWAANLSHADLRVTNLSNANLKFANLSHANLSGSNLINVIFEPDSLPRIEGIAYAQNLDFLRYEQSPSKLVLLKKSLQEAGFISAARQVNTALHREKVRHEPSFIGFMEMVLIDYTCEYGSNSTRPLLLIIFICIPCAFIYWLALHIRRGASGLYLLYSWKRVNSGDDQIRVIKLDYKSSLKSKRYRWINPFLKSPRWRAIKIACLFSLMSAFNIGFREINFGRWIRMIQSREFDIKARGWPRTVSGIQSLLSVYLVALWLLSQFGNPFEY